ncbi:protein disulfide isomerase-like 1-4 [Aegilops tauschii subsp. strangulata]|nr:protein disulfide isomerase-like 1-4 [Triticum aestivum]
MYQHLHSLVRARLWICEKLTVLEGFSWLALAVQHLRDDLEGLLPAMNPHAALQGPNSVLHTFSRIKYQAGQLKRAKTEIRFRAGVLATQVGTLDTLLKGQSDQMDPMNLCYSRKGNKKSGEAEAEYELTSVCQYHGFCKQQTLFLVSGPFFGPSKCGFLSLLVSRKCLIMHESHWNYITAVPFHRYTTQSNEGAHSDELAAASRLEESINFYQTSTPDVAKLFHIDTAAKRPSVVLLKKEEEKLTFYDGEFKASAIADFVSANKLPLILLFAVASESSKFLPIFKEGAKPFKGKLLFVFVELDNQEVGEPVADYFGITGQETTVHAYTGNEDAKKFFLDGEVSLEAIKDFAEGFLEDKLTPFYKSEPVPEPIYAPWCGHCQSLEPTYNKLAKHLRGVDSLVIAKMDGTANEHPHAKSDGYPTILFYPAGKKSFEPITFEGERTVVDMYKFIKKHASIPFKLKR